jgi:hypothetical protein
VIGNPHSFLWNLELIGEHGFSRSNTGVFLPERVLTSLLDGFELDSQINDFRMALWMKLGKKIYQPSLIQL